MAQWDVIVVGGGPAGLSAARVAAGAGARTLVLEKAEHPRYKTCGGGLIGPSMAAIGDTIEVPAKDRIERVTFTRNGRARFTRTAKGSPIVAMVRRDEFDNALRLAAERAGATVRQNTRARSVQDDGEEARVLLGDGETLSARTVIGADGSAGITARHVGVAYNQVDLGLEVELPVSPAVARDWEHRLLIDWGPLPGSYAWVFPKGDVLTVGVIAARGHGEQTRAYLKRFVAQAGLEGIEPLQDSGHLTRCRTESSPLRRGRVLVAGDAAGLLEPWTREGISFALRSGALAGAAAAADDLDTYTVSVARTLTPSMRAGRRLLAAFSRHPRPFHALMASPPGWRLFSDLCRGSTDIEAAAQRLPYRLALRLSADATAAGRTNRWTEQPPH